MLDRHKNTLQLISRNRLTSYLVRDYFNLSRRRGHLQVELERLGLGQADLVLCILHLMDDLPRSLVDRRHLLAHYVHRLVGRPILVGEPCLLQYKINGHSPRVSRARTPDDRKITWVRADNPRQPSTEAHMRWNEFKVGRTVAQLRARGITRRDLRRAQRKNWIRLEELA